MVVAPFTESANRTCVVELRARSHTQPSSITLEMGKYKWYTVPVYQGLGTLHADPEIGQNPFKMGDVTEVKAPEENCEYSVVVGRSLLSTSPSRTPADEVRDDGDAAFALFQYKFTPASVDTSVPGLVSIDESSGCTVLRGTTAHSEGGVSFKGKVLEQKETECLLIFDGTSFQLERFDLALSQLRHMRAVPAQRPSPAAFSTPIPKKFTLPSATARAGKSGAGSARPRQSKSAKGSKRVEPAAPAGGEASTMQTTEQGVASTAVEGAQTKRRRKDGGAA